MQQNGDPRIPRCVQIPRKFPGASVADSLPQVDATSSAQISTRLTNTTAVNKIVIPKRSKGKTRRLISAIDTRDISDCLFLGHRGRAMSTLWPTDETL